MLEPTAQEQTELLDLARASLRAQASGESLPRVQDVSPGLLEPAGCFVTLHVGKAGPLRGCVGSFRFDQSLAATVIEMAAASGSRDPRFSPLSPGDLQGLHVEISVLEPPRPIAAPEEIEIGRHGLRIALGSQVGVLLPQVATRFEWSAVEFLEACCEKAELPKGAWKKEAARIETFQTCTFGE